MSESVVILGGGGHARVLLELLSLSGVSVLGLTDITKPDRIPNGVAYLGTDEEIAKLNPEKIRLVNGVGSIVSTDKRRQLFERFTEKGYRFASVVHPNAILSTHGLEMGDGVQVMAGVVVNTQSRLGNNVLLNTGSVVEHDCCIGDHSHIATGAILCGGCTVGAGVHIGAGATIIQGTRIGDGAIIAAGAVVVKDVGPMTLVAGVPAREKRSTHDY